MAKVRLNWNLTEQSPQNQIGAPDQLHSELNLRPPDCNRTRPKILLVLALVLILVLLYIELYSLEPSKLYKICIIGYIIAYHFGGVFN